MNKIQYKSTDLVCLICGNVMTINRKLSRQKNIGHIKNMYCPFCKEVVKFFEVKDVSSFIWRCMMSDSLTESEVFVINLLKEREERNEQKECGVYQKILTRK